ncbi:MAG: PIG-L family deacetylase [Clostridia bacterium]|nr:PIG-L family deacetylase [Clostridia bacterium]MBQ3870192.1 PIG-L family deacetylase [Clostridia bacterium]
MRKLFIAFFVFTFLFSLCVFHANAEDVFSYEVKIDGAAVPELTDGNYNVSITASEITVAASGDIYGLYIEFFDEAVSATVYSGDGLVYGGFRYLHEYVDLSSYPSEVVTVAFDVPAGVAEISAFGSEPADIQRWDAPCENADLLLCSAHADDEQLFFAGLLPYYAGEREFEVQVVYFTDHKDDPARRHELLNGLWTVGVKHYPVFGVLPDDYSRDNDAEAAYAWALENAAAHDISEDDLIAFQVEQIRRFKPLIAVCHDLNGEYGHGQHILSTRTFLAAAEKSADEDEYVSSAYRYGVWDVPKIYVHLYDENVVVMNWDEPLARFGGQTAFQMSQKGFSRHVSQRGRWFDEWLYGSDGKLEKAADINVDPYERSEFFYSPCRYGLYRSAVGEDVMKNDLAENIETYKQKAEREAEESRRIYESESISESLAESEEESRLESEAESLSEAAESRKAAVSESKRLAAEKKEKELNSGVFRVIAISFAASFIAVTAIFIYLKKRRY